MRNKMINSKSNDKLKKKYNLHLNLLRLPLAKRYNLKEEECS